MDQDELIKDYWPRVTRAVFGEAYRWRVDTDDYEDILQSTLLSLWKTPVRWEGVRDVEALLMGSVMRHARQALYAYRGFRGNGKLTGRSQLDSLTLKAGTFQPLEKEGDKLLDERMLPPVPSAESAYFKEHRYDAIKAAVEALPERQATAVAYRYFDSLSVAEIALKMDLPKEVVNRAVSEGLRKLRNRLNPGQTSYPRAKLSEDRRVSA